MNGKKRYYLSAPEFAVCCVAAGITEIPCFLGGMEARLDDKLAGAVIWNMTRKRFLTATEGGFQLCQALSDALAVIRDSRVVIDVRQQLSTCNQPYCIVYGNRERFVSVRTGEREEDFVGIMLYEGSEMQEWIEELHLDLREAEDGAGTPELPAGPKRFLETWACPAPETPDPDGADLPHELAARIDGREIRSLKLVRRISLLRLPLWDCLASGTKDGLEVRPYGKNVLAGSLRTILSWQEE